MSNPDYLSTPRNKVKRLAERGSHDKKLVNAILDDGRCSMPSWNISCRAGGRPRSAPDLKEGPVVPGYVRSYSRS